MMQGEARGTTGHGADSCSADIYLVLTMGALRDPVARLGYPGRGLLSARMTDGLVLPWRIHPGQVHFRKLIFLSIWRELPLLREDSCYPALQR